VRKNPNSEKIFLIMILSFQCFTFHHFSTLKEIFKNSKIYLTVFPIEVRNKILGLNEAFGLCSFVVVKPVQTCQRA
jgi:hypothetical protein